MKEWYNGYQLKDNNHQIYEIYSPLSIKNTIEYDKLDSYWIQSKKCMLLKDYIDMDLDGLKEDIVGLQTDKPLKRAFMPDGGIRMACQAAEQYGYKIDENVVIFLYLLIFNSNSFSFFKITINHLKGRDEIPPVF